MDTVPPYLPYGRQAINDDDIAAVVDVLRGDYLTTGPAVDAFEKALAKVVAAPEAVACSSGTAALHLAVLALDIGPGDVVIVPSITFAATANCARYVGAEVVFADVDPRTGLMTAEHLEAALKTNRRGKAKAVLPVHLAGQAADMSAIAATAKAHGLYVIEDACHALGTTGTEGDEAYKIGDCRFSDMAVFSFHPVKTVAVGEGGAITTSDPKLAARLKRLRSHGIVREADDFASPEMGLTPTGEANRWYYEIQELGFNYRASDIHCALGLSQLSRLDSFVAARRGLVALYNAALAPFAPKVLPLGRRADCHPAWHLYVSQIDFASVGRPRHEIMSKLHARGVGSQVHYIPVPLLPYYRERYGEPDLPGANEYYARSLSLPLFVGMTPADVERVVTELGSALGLKN